VAPVHPVVRFQVANDRFDRLSSFERLLFFDRQAFEFAAVLEVQQ